MNSLVMNDRVKVTKNRVPDVDGTQGAVLLTESLVAVHNIMHKQCMPSRSTSFPLFLCDRLNDNEVFNLSGAIRNRIDLRCR